MSQDRDKTAHQIREEARRELERIQAEKAARERLERHRAAQQDDQQA